jgi:hypothetical protein
LGRQAKFKLFAKKNGLIKLQAKGEKNEYGMIAQKNDEDEKVKRQFYYISG